ncbi:hypothetical protein PInf_007072 [Phytophthora infestans]|nr:hypothetical protein PInf_007072 [Phytophthora infestans]
MDWSAATVSTRMSTFGNRSVSFKDSDDDAYDDWGDEDKVDEPLHETWGRLGVRPPGNGDIPTTNKVLARCYEKMLTSEWIRLFNPRQVRHATRAYPVNSLSTTQVTDDKVSLLQATGFETRNYPSCMALKEWTLSEVEADLHKWKKNLRSAFSVNDLAKGRQPVTGTVTQPADPAMIPLPDRRRKLVN